MLKKEGSRTSLSYVRAVRATSKLCQSYQITYNAHSTGVISKVSELSELFFSYLIIFLLNYFIKSTL